MRGGMCGLRPCPFCCGFPHPWAGYFRFGESTQSHSPEARAAEAAATLRALLAAESRSRHIPVPVARARLLPSPLRANFARGGARLALRELKIKFAR